LASVSSKKSDAILLYAGLGKKHPLHKSR